MGVSAERRLLAVISGDVADYSRLMGADEDATITALAAARDLISSSVVQHNGRLVDFTGDNFLAEFSSATHAMSCAVSVQRQLADTTKEQDPAARLQFRPGVHVGDVRVDGARLFGDGINIAARLEGLAHPGGICVSKNLLDLAGSKLNLATDALGPQRLKGITNTVEAHRITPATLSSSSANANVGTALASTAASVVPTIGVLPFENFSSDPEHAQLANAITGDIIAGLSCDHRMSVIAYNAVARYRNSNKSVREIGKELGATYLAAGTLRVAGNRIRVSVAFVDSESELEIWGGKRDFDLADLFEAVDNIVEAMVIALASHFRLTESERFQRKQPGDISAWTLAGQAAQTFIQNPATSLEGPLIMAAQAVEADPKYAFGWAVLGFLTAFKFPLGLSTDHAADIEKSLADTSRALQFDPRDPMALTARAIALQYAGRATDSLEYLQRSLRLNPSDTLTHCYYGRGMMFSGKPELALAHFERFERINPDDPAAHMAGTYHSLALMFMQRWAESEAVARRANAAAAGRNPWIWATLAIVLGAQARIDEAHATLQELLGVAPHWDRPFVEGFLRECQENKALMDPISTIIASIWPWPGTNGVGDK